MPDDGTAPAAAPTQIARRKYLLLPRWERRALQKTAAAAYARGDTIRTIAAAIGYSYATTHRILTDAGVTMRKRGGPSRDRNNHAAPPAPPRQPTSR
ncbi:helix-turn-helix domain-containing protein [Nucisporomicrobium flavum]|uniref:helix-turn-helix domain-containing protein n=1 Tax=Nucisporomicrobium flavum TaxID=2785915 RepID=UPI0018F50DB2|nr:helix-turn-helix domain-containing protein [Nucisporomicrobium flavum]